MDIHRIGAGSGTGYVPIAVDTSIVSGRRELGPVDRRDRLSRDGLIDRLEGEFREMPGLQLTVRQAARLLSLEPAACGRMLGLLATRGVIRPTGDGRYVRNQSRP